MGSTKTTSGLATTPPVKQLPSGILAPSSGQKVAGVVKNVSEKVAKVFGSDDEDDTEEMPFEARAKMRNIGRYISPASARYCSNNSIDNLRIIKSIKSMSLHIFFFALFYFLFYQN